MRFIAGIILGKLARYLRMAGYDVIYKNDAADDEIIEIAKRSGRIVLTGDSLRNHFGHINSFGMPEE